MCKSAISQHGFVSFLGGKATAELDLGESRVPGCHKQAQALIVQELEACSAFGVTTCGLASLQANKKSTYLPFTSITW